MDFMLVLSFSCGNCRLPMKLPLHTLLQPFEDQATKPTDVPLIALQCPRCKTVERESRSTEAGPQVAETAPQWEVAEWLKCEEASCILLLPLFAAWSDTTSPRERLNDVLAWRFRSVTCPAGHLVRKPDDHYLKARFGF
jgi:hypothetical protein